MTADSNVRLADKAYVSIRDFVISELQPGTRLSEASLATKYGMSKTPVREALQRLELDGLVVSIPQVGYLVPHVAYRDVRQVFEVREAIEVYSARLAAIHMSDGVLAQLVDRVAELDSSLTGSEELDLARLKDFNAELHSSIMDASDNPLMMQMLDSVQLRIQAALNHFLKHDFSRYQQSYEDHRRIVEALQTREPVICEEAMRAHIDSVNRHILARFR